jgi:hypothetical protein
VCNFRLADNPPETPTSLDPSLVNWWDGLAQIHASLGKASFTEGFAFTFFADFIAIDDLHALGRIADESPSANVRFRCLSKKWVATQDLCALDLVSARCDQEDDCALQRCDACDGWIKRDGGTGDGR